MEKEMIKNRFKLGLIPGVELLDTWCRTIGFLGSNDLLGKRPADPQQIDYLSPLSPQNYQKRPKTARFRVDLLKTPALPQQIPADRNGTRYVRIIL